MLLSKMGSGDVVWIALAQRVALLGKSLLDW
jgi:hypothetical protein